MAATTNDQVLQSVNSIATTLAPKPVPVYTFTKKNTAQPVVTRESLLADLTNATNDYKESITHDTATNVARAIGKSLDGDKLLAAPTNKGRLESQMSLGQMLIGTGAKGFNVYEALKKGQDDQAKTVTDAEVARISAEDTLRAREEAAAMKNAENNQSQTVQNIYANTTGDATSSNQRQASMIDNRRNSLEDIGTRFDKDFKDIDEMQAGSTRAGRLLTSPGFSLPDKEEKLARDQFEAWKGGMRNVLVQENREKGSGSMSDKDAEMYQQDLGNAKTPAAARVILNDFEDRMRGTQTNRSVNNNVVQNDWGNK